MGSKSDARGASFILASIATLARQAAVTLKGNTSHDSPQVEALFDETLTGEANDSEADEGLSTAGADGAYDTFDIYNAITDRRDPPVIPPQRNAKIKKHGNCDGPPLLRDEAIRYIRQHRRKK